MERDVEVVSHEEFLEGLRTGRLKFGVVRNRIPPFFEKRSPLFENLYVGSRDAENWKRLANLLSVLAFPAFLSALALPFFVTAWSIIPCLILTFLLDRAAYKCRREAVRNLVTNSPHAYCFFRLERVIVVSETGAEAGATAPPSGHSNH